MGTIKKKYKASTLVEVIIANVIIVVLFAIALLSYHQLLNHYYRYEGRDREIEQTIEKLYIQYRQKEIQLPYRKEESNYILLFDKKKKDDILHLQIKIWNIHKQEIAQKNWYEKP